MDIKMNKVLVTITVLSSLLAAEQYSAEEKMKLKRMKEELGIYEPTAKELKLRKIKKELGIEEPTGKEREIDRIRHELKIGYDVPKREGLYDDVKDALDVGDSFDDAVDSVKDTLGLEDKKKKKKKKDDDFSFQNTLSDFYETVGLEEGENWGLPSVWGFNEKKKARTFLGSKTLGATFLGDVKDSSTMFYSGMKNSGQSAEMMSGMMYNSSRMYNNMFGMFDSSPLNIFEEEKEASMFDFVEGGNDFMEMFN
jgi:hypothetical protein